MQEAIDLPGQLAHEEVKEEEVKRHSTIHDSVPLTEKQVQIKRSQEIILRSIEEEKKLENREVDRDGSSEDDSTTHHREIVRLGPQTYTMNYQRQDTSTYLITEDIIGINGWIQNHRSIEKEVVIIDELNIRGVTRSFMIMPLKFEMMKSLINDDDRRIWDVSKDNFGSEEVTMKNLMKVCRRLRFRTNIVYTKVLIDYCISVTPHINAIYRQFYILKSMHEESYSYKYRLESNRMTLIREMDRVLGSLVRDVNAFRDHISERIIHTHAKRLLRHDNLKRDEVMINLSRLQHTQTASMVSSSLYSPLEHSSLCEYRGNWILEKDILGGKIVHEHDHHEYTVDYKKKTTIASRMPTSTIIRGDIVSYLSIFIIMIMSAIGPFMITELDSKATEVLKLIGGSLTVAIIMLYSYFVLSSDRISFTARTGGYVRRSFVHIQSLKTWMNTINTLNLGYVEEGSLDDFENVSLLYFLMDNCSRDDDCISTSILEYNSVQENLYLND